MVEAVYFAYGPDMDMARITEYGISVARSYLGVLHDHRLAFDHYSSRWAGGVADCVPSDGDWIKGVCFELRGQSTAELLDRAKGVQAGVYERVPVRVAAVEYGMIVEAFTYRIRSGRRGDYTPPTARYRTALATAGMHHGFDTDYLQTIELAAEDRIRVAVYGTLKRGQPQHELLDGTDADGKEALFVETRAIDGYALMATPFGYPAAVDMKTFDAYLALVPHTKRRRLQALEPLPPIRCEVYELPRAQLDAIDRYEGYPDLFRRVRIGEAYFYIWNRAPDARFQLVAGGSWPPARKIRKRR